MANSCNRLRSKTQSLCTAMEHTGYTQVNVEHTEQKNMKEKSMLFICQSVTQASLI